MHGEGGASDRDECLVEGVGAVGVGVEAGTGFEEGEGGARMWRRGVICACEKGGKWKIVTRAVDRRGDA